jgi:hypothetical protein
MMEHRQSEQSSWEIPGTLLFLSFIIAWVIDDCFQDDLASDGFLG